MPPEIASIPKATVATKPVRSKASAIVMSGVGTSRASSNTLRLMSSAMQIWLIAAPPAAKFATICFVTEAG